MDSDRIVKVNKAAEKFWLVAVIAAAVMAIHAIVTEGWDEGKQMLVIPAIAGLWYGFRRSFRKRMERNA